MQAKVVTCAKNKSWVPRPPGHLSVKLKATKKLHLGMLRNIAAASYEVRLNYKPLGNYT